jgi:hypothetical protein
MLNSSRGGVTTSRDFCNDFGWPALYLQQRETWLLWHLSRASRGCYRYRCAYLLPWSRDKLQLPDLTGSVCNGCHSTQESTFLQTVRAGSALSTRWMKHSLPARLAALWRRAISRFSAVTSKASRSHGRWFRLWWEPAWAQRQAQLQALPSTRDRTNSSIFQMLLSVVSRRSFSQCPEHLSGWRQTLHEALPCIDDSQPCKTFPLTLSPQPIAGCPTSRSFFARCGTPQASPQACCGPTDLHGCPTFAPAYVGRK